MCRRWFILLIPLFILAGTSTLEEEATVAASSKIEDNAISEDLDISNTHQLFKRRFTGYKDFNKYKFTKSKGRIQRFFLRNPFASTMRSKRSSTEMLRMLKTLFVDNSEERNDSEEINLPISIKGNAIHITGNNGDASIEDIALHNKIINKIDKTLTKLNDKLDALEDVKEHTYLMLKVPIDENDKKHRAKRETEPKDMYEDDSVMTVISLTKPNNQQTTTEPNSDKVEEILEVESNTTIPESNTTILLDVEINEIDKNDTTSLVDPDTNKTEEIKNKELDYESLAELGDLTRKSYQPNYNDYILKMEEILNVIQINLSPIKSIKETYSNNAEYKVGYIVANLELAEETIVSLLNKLKTTEFPTDHMEHLLDKVTISNMVVSNLMNFLGKYANLPVTSQGEEIVQ